MANKAVRWNWLLHLFTTVMHFAVREVRTGFIYSFCSARSADRVYLFILQCEKCGRGLFIHFAVREVRKGFIYSFCSARSADGVYLFILQCEKCGRGLFIHFAVR